MDVNKIIKAMVGIIEEREHVKIEYEVVNIKDKEKEDDKTA